MGVARRMIIGGYSYSEEYKETNFVKLREVSFGCSVEELGRLSLFFSQIYDELKSYDFPYGACTIQFQDWDRSWQEGTPDIVLVISEQG